MSNPAEQPSDNAANTPRRFDSLEQEAFLNLWRTYDRLHMLEEELFLRYELTPQQYNALRLLRGEGNKKLPTLALAARLVSRPRHHAVARQAGRTRPDRARAACR